MKIIRKILSSIKNWILDIRSTFYLKKVKRKGHSASKKMKVGFVVFEPETWDKLSPIYNSLKNNENIVVNLIIVPSYDQELRVTTQYGKELAFFENIDSKAFLAYNNGTWINIKRENYDYIFYQDPYNNHMPFKLKSSHVVKFSKICYIPYGYTGSNDFNEGNTNKSFFRNVYYEFVDVIEIKNILCERYKQNVEKGLQHFVNYGYPSFEQIDLIQSMHKIKKILWTPRWSYEPKIGGSHFFEYKEKIVSLAKTYPLINVAIRPHPMMFNNFINNGLMDKDEKENYCDKLKENDIEISQGLDLETEFCKTDLLITDWSSIIPMFFLTGKPIIYCVSDIELNLECSLISEGMYLAYSWDDIEKHVKDLIQGNDYLFDKRNMIIKKMQKEHRGATERIINELYNDYVNSEI